MKRILLFFLALAFAQFIYAQPIIELEPYVGGFNNPVDIANAGDDRLFIVEQAGIIRIIDGNGDKLAEPFLDIRNRIRSGGEQGLLGLVFHPDYSENGYFYVNYTSNDDPARTTIARFQVLADNPNRASTTSEKILLQIEQPYSNHNAGDLAFGPDGYLYIPLGDGGSGGDPDNFSQDRLTFLGKLLRIDVDNGDPYAIPPDNPFAMDDFTLDEIWAIGLRNPWRFSFDRLTGDMWIGDVGQNRWEEIDFQPANSTGGENYGWDCFEGSEMFALSSPECGNDTYFDPIFEYPNNGDGCSVTGGFVYRGSDYPELYGKYIFTDFCSGQFWTIQQNENGTFTSQKVGNFNNFDYSSFGEDQNGELYLAGLATGTIFRVTELCSAFTSDTLTINENEAVFSVPDNFETYQWYFEGTLIEGATAATYAPAMSGLYTVEVMNEQGCTKTSQALEFVITSVEKLQLADLQVQPNPFEQNVQVTITPLRAAVFQIELRDVLGRLIFEQQESIQKKWSSTINTAHLTSGIYFLTIRSKEKELVKKLIKQ